MSCTTILAGRLATNDGSTLIARNDDSGAGSFTPKKMMYVSAEKQGTKYRSVLSHAEIDLPKKAYSYVSVPNALPGEGIWAACAVNENNVAMTATETIASNERTLGADPLVVYKKREGRTPEKPGGIGEEDLVSLIIPYIKTAREGVLRLSELLEKYGTYEMNGMAFSDEKEIWYAETIGGHHFIARRVPDDSVVIMPNQLGIDHFDIDEALSSGKDYLCSKDLLFFIKDNHLDLSNEKGRKKNVINPRDVFGTHDDADHVYNTPRAWYMERRLCSGDVNYRPDSDDIPWCVVPDKKITVEEVKYLLSSHFQGTPFDPYGSYGDDRYRGAFRSIGINRTDFMGMVQIRPYAKEELKSILWLSFASNAFNAMLPVFAQVDDVPQYLKNTKKTVDTSNFYWASRLIAALSDASFKDSRNAIERYTLKVQSENMRHIKETDSAVSKLKKKADIVPALKKANEDIASFVKNETDDTLLKVLNNASNNMKNQYKRSDA